jgi:two-component system, cell cycle sensor histidine kinase and response regulator CckA
MTYSLLTRPDRLAALRHTALLDTPPEEGFDRLTRMASRLLGTPVALISLVAEDRQFFKSAIGLPEPWATRRGAPLSFSFCAQVVSSGEQLVVEDARKHPLLRHSTAIRELGWVAYAGVPLVTRDGQTVGCLSVVDKMPRLWSERDIALLKDLAASAVSEMELRREIGLRRQAELGRRENEGQFYNAFDQAGIGMAVISPDGRWLRVNHALADMLGYSPEDLIGSSAEARIHPEDIPADREAMRLLLTGESRTYTMEKRYLTHAGEILWALVNVSLVSDVEGEPAHLVAAIQDITERKQAESAMRASEERYRFVLQAAREVVWEWDLLTDDVTWDLSAEALLGYPPAELGATANWWYERLHPDDRERVVSSLNSAIASGETIWSEEYRFRRADGGFAEVQSHSRIVHDETNAPARIITALGEIAHGASAERQLSEVLDALPYGIWVVDRQQRIVLENAASQEIWGSLRGRQLDQLAEYMPTWGSADQPVATGEWAASRVLATGQAVMDQEISLFIPDTGARIVLNSAAPIRDADGQIVGAVSISTDITRARAESDAASQRREQERQADKMNVIGRLAGGIAHDFNNLLTGILTYSELILQELRPSDPIRADVQQIQQAGQRAAGVTRQLLAFSRRQALQPRVLSLNALLAELEPMLGRLLGHDVALDLLLDPAAGNVRIDPGQMEQVIVNLVSNARDAMPNGGRVLIMTTNVEGQAPQVALTIEDTGAGMDPATQARIFEPFFTTKQGSSGTGLGLSTVLGVIEQSGGRISVESQLGRGSTFTIHLPQHTGSEPALTTLKREVAQGGSETLLLVEDEATVRASVRRLLEWHGYHVIEATDATDALRMYDEDPHAIDLVLTDVLMPGMTGQELVHQLRTRNPELKVVYMSGYTERAIGDTGSMPHGTGFVEKPFTVDTLMRTLREVLDARAR